MKRFALKRGALVFHGSRLENRHPHPALAGGTLKAGVAEFDAGKIGKMEVQGDNILLGKSFIFNKANIHQFDF